MNALGTSVFITSPISDKSEVKEQEQKQEHEDREEEADISNNTTATQNISAWDDMYRQYRTAALARAAIEAY